MATMRLAIIMLIVAGCVDSVRAEWVAQTNGDTSQLSGIAFASDDQTGWAVGAGGTIITSTDGGATWSGQSSPVTGNLWDVHFYNDQKGWVVATIGKIVATTDGGANWLEQTTPVTENLYGVHFYDDQIGGAVGGGGTIVTTTDGGATWAEQTSSVTVSLLGVHFSSNQTGWAVGGGGEVLKYVPAAAAASSGCPEATNVIYSEGFFDTQATSTGTNPRECTVTFDGAPGTILSLDWISFSVGACGDEYVVVKDGLDAATTANSIGDAYCAGNIPTGHVLFTGHAGSLQIRLSDSSHFKIWVNHNSNPLTFVLPENPSFALGSDISIGYTFAMNMASTRDSGWVGLYKDGSCNSGTNTAHECYLARRTLGPEPTGNVIFYTPDYKSAGWYELRYFAGEASGTVCEVPASLENWNSSYTNESSADYSPGNFNATHPSSWVIPQRCIFEAISTARIYITPDARSYTPGTRREQLPGYELTLKH